MSTWGRVAFVVLLAFALTFSPGPLASGEQRLREIWFDGGCVEQTNTTDVRASADVDGFAGRRLDWVLRRGAAVIDSGRLGWFAADQEYGPLDFTLGPGRYRLTITRADRDQIVADQVFHVLRCVTAKVSCRAVTLRNPSGNRAVRVEYWGDDHLLDRAKHRKLTLAPGRSRTVRTYAPVFQWQAVGPGGAPAGDGTEGGGSELTVNQHCGPTRTRGVVGCATARRGLLRAWFHPPDDRHLRYRVDDFYEKVSSGRVGRDRYLRLWLKPSASYAFSSFTSTAAQPYDRVDLFEVVRCVIARPRPSAVRFRNPTDRTVRIAYRVVGVQDKIVFRLRAGAARTVPVPPGELRWHTNALRPVSRWRSDRGRGVLQINP